jgi:beta-lactamase class A
VIEMRPGSPERGTLREWIEPAVAEASTGAAQLALVVADADTGEIAQWRADEIVPVASAAKILLLGTVARLAADEQLSLSDPVPLEADDRVGGTGMLSKLSGNGAWSVGDLALLVAAVSDNTATNALLRSVGIDAVTATARAAGLEHLRIHDKVRDERLAQDPPVFATGTARDLARFMELVATGQLHDQKASATVLNWMAANEDHGLLCAAVRHDPHSPASEPVQVWNKTGRDTGVRADIGLAVGDRGLAYAAVATCEPGREWQATEALRVAGAAIGAAASPGVTAPGAGRSRG